MTSTETSKKKTFYLKTKFITQLTESLCGLVNTQKIE